MLEAVKDAGGYTRMLSDRLRELEAQQDEITERIARAPVDIPDIHPNVADIYRRKVARPADALNHPDDRHEATAALRGLIERIVLTPGGKRGELHATLHGQLGTINEMDRAHQTRRQRREKLRQYRLSWTVSLGGCAGLTHASTYKKPSGVKKMDCRVTPGNDDEQSFDA